MLNDTEVEALIDRRVHARLRSDRDYLFAEDAEQQAWAEHKIEMQEELAVMLTLIHHPEAQTRVAEVREELQRLLMERL